MTRERADNMRFQYPTEEQLEAYEERVREICPKFVEMMREKETFLFLHLGGREENAEGPEDSQSTCILHGDRDEMLFLLFGLMDELDTESVKSITGKGYSLLSQTSVLASMPVQGEA